MPLQFTFLYDLGDTAYYYDEFGIHKVTIVYINLKKSNEGVDINYNIKFTNHPESKTKSLIKSSRLFETKEELINYLQEKSND